MTTAVEQSQGLKQEKYRPAVLSTCLLRLQRWLVAKGTAKDSRQI